MWLKSISIVTSIYLVLALDDELSNSDAKLVIRSNSSLPYVIIGSSISLDCVLLLNNTSVNDVNVDWFKYNGDTVTANPYFRYSYSDFIKRSSVLTIKEMERYYGGTYTCKTSHNGHDLSATVEVQPVKGISFSADCGMKQNIVADDGEGTINCHVLANLIFKKPKRTRESSSNTDDVIPADVEIQWYKNEKPYTPPSGRCHFNSSIGIVCDEFVEADAGIYIIVARMTSTVKQTTNRTIVVEVHTYPRIQNLPTEVVAVEHSTVKLSCSATGKPAPIYRWVNNDLITNFVSLRRFRYDIHSGKLIFRDVSRHDAGLISCFAQNGVGGDKKNVKLVVTTADGAPLNYDRGTGISSQNDLPSSKGSATSATNMTAILVKIILCFVIVFMCFLVVLYCFEAKLCATCKGGVTK